MKIILKYRHSLGFNDKSTIESHIRIALAHITDVIWIKSVNLYGDMDSSPFSHEPHNPIDSLFSPHKSHDPMESLLSPHKSHNSTGFYGNNDIKVEVSFELQSRHDRKLSNRDVRRKIRDAIGLRGNLELIEISGLDDNEEEFFGNIKQQPLTKEVKIPAISVKEQRDDEVSYDVNPLFFNHLACNTDYLHELLKNNTIEAKLVCKKYLKSGALAFAGQIESIIQKNPGNDLISPYKFLGECFTKNPELKQHCLDERITGMCINENVGNKYELEVKLLAIPTKSKRKKIDETTHVASYNVHPLFFMFASRNNDFLNTLLRENIVEATLAFKINPKNIDKLVYTGNIAYSQISQPSNPIVSRYKFLGKCLVGHPELKRYCINERITEMCINANVKSEYELEVKLLAISAKNKQEKIGETTRVASYNVHPLFLMSVLKNNDFLNALFRGNVVKTTLTFKINPKNITKLVYMSNTAYSKPDQPSNTINNPYKFLGKCLVENSELKRNCLIDHITEICINTNVSSKYELEVKLSGICTKNKQEKIGETTHITSYNVHPLFFMFASSDNDFLTALLRGNIVEATLGFKISHENITKLVYTYEISYSHQPIQPRNPSNSPYKFLAECFAKNPELKQKCLNEQVAEMHINASARGKYELEVKLLAISVKNKRKKSSNIIYVASYNVHPLFFTFASRDNDFLNTLFRGNIVKTTLGCKISSENIAKLAYTGEVTYNQPNQPRNPLNPYKFLGRCFVENPELKQSCLNEQITEMCININISGQHELEVELSAMSVKDKQEKINETTYVASYSVHPLFFMLVSKDNHLLNILLRGNIIGATLTLIINSENIAKLAHTGDICYSQPSQPRNPFNSPYKFFGKCLAENPKLKQNCLENRITEITLHKTASGEYGISTTFAQQESAKNLKAPSNSKSGT